MSAETDVRKAGLDAYTDTLSRMEPDIAMVDTGAALASIAISLKRIADSLARIDPLVDHATPLILEGIAESKRR